MEKLRPQVAKIFSKFFSEFSFQIYLLSSTSHLLNSNLKKTFFSALPSPPIPESLLEISNDLQNLSSSGAEIYDEAENFIFEPILTNEPNGAKNYSASFIKKFGSPSVYHPVCCKIKESL